MKNKIIYVVAAGSGGHILPALTLAKRWIENTHGGKVVFWGSNKAIDQKVIANATFLSEFIGINLTGFSLKKIWSLPILIFWLIFAFFKCMYRCIKQRPEKIICTGGLIGIPTCLAGRLTGTSIEIYELNVVPGKAVKALMPIASKIYIAFEQTKKYCTFLGINLSYKCELTNYPIRFSEQDRLPQDKNKIIEQINKDNVATKAFSSDRKTIFILGGSQGSVMLNECFKEFLKYQPNIHGQVQVVHQIGNREIETYRAMYQSLYVPAIIFAYNEDLKNLYQLSDLIICRAGAGTIFEVEFFKKPCIVIPLVAATTSHQVQNAQAIAQKHPTLFTMIDQAALAANNKILCDEIINKLGLNN
ncbi:MAG: UDP diphospho-muramoyl pentapeptide beta-N acetylglucosaminyl transferase [candidate division TM6 bacterium GW2011_GWF2_37_49]|nr:MAG: UDP diphospho-muramoyl pentapeptide beta-N acetylglucosaminyl transferase [candidate division TM6 bacterium GW2011_GWF2_37_49]